MNFSVASPSKKNKTKAVKYKVDSAQSKLIKEDSVNQKLWEEALGHTAEGHQVLAVFFSETNCLRKVPAAFFFLKKMF